VWNVVRLDFLVGNSWGNNWAVVTIVNNNNRKQQNYFPREDDTLEILKKRYARGEINCEQFEKMKKDLNNTGYACIIKPSRFF
jgi:hypothetical protein